VKRSIVRHDIRTASGVHRITQRVDLDELVIPGVVHLEDMGDGVWHVALGEGDHEVILSVSRRGVTVVEVAAGADETLRALEGLGAVGGSGPENTKGASAPRAEV
jgi:hypothetical protein